MSAVPTCSTAAITTPLRVSVVFAIERAANSKIETPVGDGDNYEKALYDLLQAKGYLKDDRQITTATWRKRFVPHGRMGYTEIVIENETEELEI